MLPQVCIQYSWTLPQMDEDSKVEKEDKKLEAFMTMLNQKNDNWLAGASKQSQKNIKYFLKLCENLYRRWLSP